MVCDKYGGDHPRILCYKENEVIRVPSGIKKELYWFDNVVPTIDKKLIDMRSNNRGLCCKQYMSETVEYMLVFNISVVKRLFS